MLLVLVQQKNLQTMLWFTFKKVFFSKIKNPFFGRNNEIAQDQNSIFCLLSTHVQCLFELSGQNQ